MADNTDDDADKGKSQIEGNWFGNLVYWLIGYMWIGGIS